MSLLEHRFANTDPTQFDQTSLALFKLLLDPNGGIEATAAGIRLKQNGFPTGRGLLDPAGGTIALPTAGGAETTVRIGEALETLDYYVITSDGTVGGLAVEKGDVLYVNGATLPPAADTDFTVSNGEAVAAAATFRTETFTLTAAQITGGVTLAGTPIAPTETTMTIAGAGSQQYTTDFTVATNVLSFTAAVQALLVAGDEITVQWK